MLKGADVFKEMVVVTWSLSLKVLSEKEQNAMGTKSFQNCLFSSGVSYSCHIWD